MIYDVELIAFGKPGEIRQVNVPDSQLTEDHLSNLQLVFHYGQNDFQKLPHPSVSVGDIINYNNEKFLVAAIGFKNMTKKQYEDHVQKSRVWGVARDLCINPDLLKD